MTLYRLFLFLILKGVFGNDNSTNNSGIQLWRAQGVLSEDVLSEFYDRARYTEEIWKRDNRTIDFLIFDHEVESITEFLKENNLNYTVLIPNVQGKFNETVVNSFATRRHAVSGDSFTWTEYPKLNDVNRYLVKIFAKYPSYCKITAIGRTLNYKPINMLTISNGKSNKSPILIVSGTHGREWTGVISTLYFIESIARNFSEQPRFIKKRQWHFVPVLNPDGYEYSMSSDKTWTKNRRQFNGCYGVDLNMNFDYNWGVKNSSRILCSHDYYGPAPFSEEETKALKRLVEGTHFHGYVSIHSSGNKVVFPTSRNDYNTHFEMTKEMGQAMHKIAGTNFLNGGVQIKNGLGIDWMYHKMKVLHSYMIETRNLVGPALLQRRDISVAAREVRAGLWKFAELLR